MENTISPDTSKAKRQVQPVNPTPTFESFKRPMITYSNSWIPKTQSKWKVQWEGPTCSSVKALIKKSSERKKIAGKKKWWRGWLEEGSLLCCIWHVNGSSHGKKEECPEEWKLSKQVMWPTQLRGIFGETQLSKRQVTHVGTAAPFTTQGTLLCSTQGVHRHTASEGSDPWAWWKLTQPRRRRKECPLQEHYVLSRG